MLDDVFEKLNRHFSVSHETFAKLILYHDLLIKWQKSINLVSNTSIKEVWERHFLDSLQLCPHIQNNKSIVDIGTGAGFPGMVLAICGIPNIHLIESDSKKITFLKEVARITDTDVSIHNTRIEDCVIDNVTLILSRALANISRLLDLSMNFVSHETKCFFHKGKNWANELEDANEFYSFNHEIIPSVTDPEGVILKLSHIRRRPYDPEKILQN